MVRKATFKGYVLEELLAFLIRNTGYRLLVDPTQDPEELAWLRGGLVVKGRGTDHQADVLGELSWIPAFTFPIRLFIEAKCTNHKTGLSVVRAAVGVLHDLNQNFSKSQAGKRQIPLRRYSYNCGIFSTCGFTTGAMQMAMAHQISLIDLSGPDFDVLRNALERVTDSIWNARPELFQVDDDRPNQPRIGRRLLTEIRAGLRRQFGTWPEGVHVQQPARLQEELFTDMAADALEDVRRLNEFLVGMATGPFLLVLKPADLEAFLRYAKDNPSHRVRIRWNRKEDGGRNWRIHPLGQPDAYTLSFGLPEGIYRWIFRSEDARRRARQFKATHLSQITIYRHEENQDSLYRLIYDANAPDG